MSYPLSSEVSAGQPTAAAHYNTLRSDAVLLGQASADSLPLGTFFRRFASGVTLQALATNRLRVPYNPSNPATVMVNGCMLQAMAAVDLPAGQFSGAAATWYVFARRTAGSTTFTLEVNTSSSEGADQRMIGSAYWNGTTLGAIRCDLAAPFPPADYDSGWFAVATGTLYTRAHSLVDYPRLVQLEYCASADGSGERGVVGTVQDNAGGGVDLTVLSYDGTNVYVKTGAAAGVIHTTRFTASSGYYRLLAWK
jgi:hypothetical protein